MSTAGIIKVSAACPVFDGTEYPYWKNKMRMHVEAIDVDLWYVVKNGVPKAGEGVTAADVKKFIQLDSTAKNIICGHLTKGQYGRVSALKTSKLVWDWLSKVNEGTRCTYSNIHHPCLPNKSTLKSSIFLNAIPPI